MFLRIKVHKSCYQITKFMNCIILDDDILTQKQLTSFIQKSDLLELKACFFNPKDVANFIEQNQIDIIFLDIEMPLMSGLEFLGQTNYNASVIIISGNKKYALNSYEYEVADYLLKPIEYPRFLKAIYKIIEREHDKIKLDKTDRIFLKIAGKYERIKFSDIVFIQEINDCISITTKNSIYIITCNKFKIEKFLQNKMFYKLDDEHTINLKEVTFISHTKVEFFNDFFLDDDIYIDSTTLENIKNKIKEIEND